MAKKSTPISDSGHEEEMSVVVLKFRGSGETLRRGMDTVAQAIASIGGPSRIVTRTVDVRKPQTHIGAPTDMIDTEAADDSETETVDREQDETEPTPPASKTPAKPRKFNFISEISDNATTPLKDFVAQRSPSEINDRYLVVCLWLQTAAEFEVFTPDHVWTCFRMMEWKMLTDFTQPMRLLKSKKSYFDTPKKGEWKLNPHGLEVAQAIKPPTV